MVNFSSLYNTSIKQIIIGGSLLGVCTLFSIRNAPKILSYIKDRFYDYRYDYRYDPEFGKVQIWQHPIKSDRLYAIKYIDPKEIGYNYETQGYAKYYMYLLDDAKYIVSENRNVRLSKLELVSLCEILKEDGYILSESKETDLSKISKLLEISFTTF